MSSVLRYLAGYGDGALAVVEEHWIRGPSVLLDNPLVDLALDIRNRWMVRNLALVAERRCHRQRSAARRQPS